MNRRLQQVRSRFWIHLAHLAGLGASLACVLAVSAGCATNRPARLLVEPRLANVTATAYSPEQTLSLVTFNIWGLPAWMNGARSGRYPRIARELERLDADIILLQEAWTARARTAAPTNGHWSVARAAGQYTFFQQCGLLTLSKCPIVGGEFYPFSRAAFPDRFVNKGVLKVTVQLAGGRLLNVWNVHLQDGGSTEVRLSQVRELVSRVETAEDGQIADLVGGDFNCTPGSSLFAELTKSLGPTAQQISGGEPFATWDGLSVKPGAGQTLDHIFIRSQRASQIVSAVPHVAFSAPSLQERLSDHFGIEAVLHLGDAQPSLVGALTQNPALSDSVPDGRVYAGGD